MEGIEGIDRVYCNKCHEVLRYKDHVYLDITNAMLHQRCYKGYEADMPIQDGGTFKQMVNRYDFFSEFRLKG